MKPINTLDIVCDSITSKSRNRRASTHLYMSDCVACPRAQVLRLKGAKISNPTSEKGALRFRLGSLIEDMYCCELREKAPTIEQIPIYRRVEGVDQIVSGRIDVAVCLGSESALVDVTSYCDQVNDIRKRPTRQRMRMRQASFSRASSRSPFLIFLPSSWSKSRVLLGTG